MQPESLAVLNRAMARLADGDRTAAEEVFALLWPELRRFVGRAVGAGADADDVAQLALEKIFVRAADYDPTRSALTWALAIASWECRTHLTTRRRQARRGGEDAMDIPSALPSPEDATVTQGLLEALRDVLESLSASDRVTLEQSFLADVEAPKSPTFRKRKERALERLRAGFRKLYGI